MKRFLKGLFSSRFLSGLLLSFVFYILYIVEISICYYFKQIDMSLQILDEFPQIICQSQLGLIQLHEMVDGKWAFVVSFHSAFDPVSSTELATLGKMVDEFESRNIALVCIVRETGFFPFDFGFWLFVFQV